MGWAWFSENIYSIWSPFLTWLSWTLSPSANPIAGSAITHYIDLSNVATHTHITTTISAKFIIQLLHKRKLGGRNGIWRSLSMHQTVRNGIWRSLSMHQTVSFSWSQNKTYTFLLSLNIELLCYLTRLTNHFLLIGSLKQNLYSYCYQSNITLTSTWS